MKNRLTVGIIGAMDCEISELKNKLEDLKETKYSELLINTGTLFNHNIVLVKSGVGKVNAALCTQFIIDKFQPDYIINTGIAGGIAENLEVGDIVIGEDLVQYDFDVSAIGYAKGYMCTGKNSDKPTLFSSDKKLISTFEKINISKGKILKGIIASGDTFVSDIKKKNEIRQTFNATAVEMEGCAIAQVSTVNKIPFLIARAISDLADNNAGKSHIFVEEEIAKVSSSAICDLLEELSNEKLLKI